MIRSAPRMHVLLPLSQLSQLELPTTVATVDVVVRHQVMSSCLCLFPFFDIFQFRLNLHSNFELLVIRSRYAQPLRAAAVTRAGGWVAWM